MRRSSGSIFCFPDLLHEGRGTIWLSALGIDRRVLALFMVTTAFAQTSDVALANEVSKRTRHDVFYSVFDDVEGTVHDGVVSLTDKVRMPFIASEIAELVARVPGV